MSHFFVPAIVVAGGLYDTLGFFAVVLGLVFGGAVYMDAYRRGAL